MSAVYNSTVQGFYLSYYGRPADPAGLTFWTGQLAAAGGNLSSILNAFGTSPEATRRYGTGTTESKIQAVYQQTFGRAADATGLAFYNTEITAGRITLIDMSKRIIDGATGDDVSIRNNRLSAAQSFTDKLDTDAEKAGYSGAGAEDAARAWVATVTKDAATVTAAVATADSTITALLPQTFTLTTNQDKFTGSAGNDTISGGSNALTSADTLAANDQIDGGAGADVFNMSVSKSFSGFTVGTGFLKNVETVNITNAVATTYDVSLRGATGVESLNVSGRVNLSGLTSLDTKLAYSGQASTATLTIGHDSEKTTGSADKVSMSVTSLGTAPTSSTAQPVGSVIFTTTDIEEITLSATGSNFIGFSAGSATDSVKTLTISGTGSVRMSDTTAGAGVSTALKTLNASALEGALNVNLGNANGVTSVSGGKGADTITVLQTTDSATRDLSLTASISGGDGADTLVLSTSGGAAVNTGFAMTGVETVSLLSIATATPLNFSASSVTGLETITVGTAAANGVTSAFTGLGSAPIKINITPDGTATAAAHTVSVDTTGSVTVEIPISSTVTAESTATYASDNVTASKAASVTLNTPKYADWIGTLAGTVATSMTISGEGDIGQDVANQATLSAPVATSVTLNQTNKDVTWNLDLSTSSDSKLTDLTVKSAGTVALVTPATNDLTKLERVTFESGAGTFSFNDEADLNTLTSATLSGATSTSAIGLANTAGMGSTTLAYGITVNATGLKAGLEIAQGLTGANAINVGPSQTVTLNIGGVDGRTRIGDVIVNSSGGAIVVNAEGHGDGLSTAVNAFSAGTITDTLTLGALTTTNGTVSVNVKGATNDVSVGDVAGKSLTLDAGTAEGTVTLGTVTLRDSVTYYGTNAAANTETFVLSTASTAFTADLKGGFLVDTFTISGSNTAQASITVKGDLGDGTDSLTISSVGSTVTAGQVINIADLVSYNRSTIEGSRPGKNTITGGSGIDTIIGGAGADTLTGGAGGDIFTLRFTTDTGTISGINVTRGASTVTFTAGAYTITGGDVISTSTFDKILDFTTADRIVTNQATLTIPDPDVKVGYAWLGTTTTNASTTNNDGIVTGTYNATAQTFTFSNSGSDSIYIFDQDGTSLGDYSAIVLVGYTTTLADDTPATDNTGLVGSTS